MEDEKVENVVSSSNAYATAVEAIEDFDLEGSDTVPTIELSEEAELCDLECQANNKRFNENDDEDGDCGGGSMDAPVAVPLGSLLSTGGMENEFNCSNSRRFEQRAEFISATVIKPNRRTDVGLSLSPLIDGGSGLCISGIKKKSLLFESGAPLEEGDRVLSINNQSCDEMDPKKAAKLLRGARGPVTIVVQNVGGDPLMVQCMIEKPAPDHRTGIGFSSSENPAGVHISAIFLDGLFVDSLLTEGDEVLSVQSIPCRELESEAVADIVITAPKYVTIVAKKFEGNGVVVACDGSPDKRRKRSSRGDTTQRSNRIVGPGCQLIFCAFFLTSVIIIILFLVVSPLSTET